MRRRFFSKFSDAGGGTYFTIEALTNSFNVKLSNNSCEYCVDMDGNWKKLSAGAYTQTISAGLTLSFRANLTPVENNGIGTFTITKSCKLKGNIMSLLHGDDFKSKTSLEGTVHTFRKLFQGSAVLDASELVLPATTLTIRCYQDMFNSCLNLTKAPKILPATTLADFCYTGMFSVCTSLLEAPILPATNLAIYCYNYMFNSCTSLVNLPELPATTLSNYCYRYTFNGCTSATTAPELPAGTLVDYCYERTFSGCSKLNYIKMLATNINATGCLSNWVNGVASTGTFVRNASMSSLPTGTSGIPSGWTVEDYVETNLITFTIDGTEYQAEEGMTWEEWCNSEYNTDGYFIAGTSVDNYVSSQDGVFMIEYVIPQDHIIPNNDYLIAPYGPY